MGRTEKVTLTNMCMIYDGEGNVLIQHRTDPGWSGIVFPGGHIEIEESIIESVIREIKEETGLDISLLEQCGIKQFFTEKDGRYIVFLYKTKNFSGEVKDSGEGKMEWVKFDNIKDMSLASGFEDMLPLFRNESSELIYRNGGKEWKR